MADEDVEFIRVIGEELVIAGLPAGDRMVVLANLRRLRAERESFEEALQSIARWSTAYPLDIFPEPDLKKAAELLGAGGITLDAVSAHCMRHVIDGVGKIARDALTEAGHDGILS